MNLLLELLVGSFGVFKQACEHCDLRRGGEAGGGGGLKFRLD